MKKISIRFAKGTGKQGDLVASYMALRNAFGVPSSNTSMDDKVTEIWVLDTVAGPATIYAYKRTEEGINLEDVKEWSIGGKNKEVVYYVKNHLKAMTGICGGCGHHNTTCMDREECNF